MAHRKLSKKRVAVALGGVMLCIAVIYLVLWRLDFHLVGNGEIKIEVGGELSRQVEDYVDLTWYLPFEKEEIIEQCHLEFGDISYLDGKENCPQIGRYQATLMYQDQNYDVTILVEDSTPPTITCQETVTYGTQSFQIEDIVEVNDNSLEECEVKIEGQVDPHQLGSYEVQVSAVDPSSNRQEQSFEVEVKDQTAPQITYPLQIAYLNEDFDALQGVKAQDDVDGDCSDDLQVSGTVNVKKAGTYQLTYTVQDQAGNKAQVKRQVVVKKKETSYRIQDVPMIMQLPQYHNGCESASSTMLLQYYGYDISLSEFIQKVPTIPLENKNGRLYGADPQEAFTGSMSSRGYGIYAKPIVKVMQDVIDEKKGKQTVKNVTGSSLDDLLTYVEMGYPVQIWATASLQTYEQSGKQQWYVKTLDGEYTDKKITFPVSEHCLVLIGFDEEHVIVNNPLQGVTTYDREAFEKAYQGMGSQAIIIEAS